MADQAITPFSTNHMMGVVANLKRAINGLRKKFVTGFSQSTSQFVSFDVDDKKRYVAPFVHHRVRGKVRPARSQQVKTFVPAYIKQNTPFEPERAFVRAAGEAFGGELTPQQRLDMVLASTLQDHLDAIDLRLEMMTVESLLQGKVTVTGDDYPTQVVDFGRDASLSLATNTLSGTDLWSSGSAQPLKFFSAKNKQALKLSGSVTPDIVMDADAWDAFENHQNVTKKLDLLKYDAGTLSNVEIQQEGLVLRGQINGYRIWTYSGFYYDEAANDELDIMAGGYVIGIGAIDAVEHYGAIKDLGSLNAVPVFAKNWVENDPSELILQTQSAPFVGPRRANASWAAKVLP
jgi:hypothetical protein